MFLLLAMLFGISSHAIEKGTDGYYLIGSDADYEEFCQMVADGNPYANARLTADITVTTPLGLGNDEFQYRGTFDGDGHTVTLNLKNTDNWTDGYAFIQHAKPGCVVRNLHVAGTIESDQKYLASIVGDATGVTLENCISSATLKCGLSGDATLGGLVGVSYGETVIDNCAFVGTIDATNAEDCAGLIGWNDHMAQVKSSFVAGTYNIASADNHRAFVRNMDTTVEFFSNNYFLNNSSALSNTTSATNITAESLTNGDLCYKLNSNGKKGVVWYQGDAFPMPFKTASAKQVVNSNGKIVLGGTCATHDFADNNHICKNCGAIEEGAAIEPLQYFDISETGTEGYVNYLYYRLNRNDHTAEVAGVRKGFESDFPGTVKAVSIPETINVKGELFTVTTIGDKAFSKNGSLPQIKYAYIPGSVNTIKNNAFEGTSDLKKAGTVLISADGYLSRPCFVYSIAISLGLTTAALAVRAPMRAERSPMRNLVQSKFGLLFMVV